MPSPLRRANLGPTSERSNGSRERKWSPGGCGMLALVLLVLAVLAGLIAFTLWALQRRPPSAPDANEVRASSPPAQSFSLSVAGARSSGDWRNSR